MNIVQFIILIIIILGSSIALFLFFSRKFKDLKGKIKDDESIVRLQGQVGEISSNIQSHHQENIKIVEDVTKKLGDLDSTNKQVINFADQLQNLQDILKNPKQRGILGEFYLETVLKNVLPPKIYKMQYNLGRDQKTDQDLIVDAAIFIKDKILPIDAKFSLENYNRLIKERDKGKRIQLEKILKADLKHRIEETSKYVQPGKGTFDFAFMFIPSEAIYYDLLIGEVGGVSVSARDLIEYAFRDKKVIIVSPTTFFAYLQMVFQGLQSLQIEEHTKEIQRNIEKLGRHIIQYDEFLKRLGNNLETTVNAYNNAHKEFQKMDKDILKITKKEQNKIESLYLDKPRKEE
ncbi:DNA recombination protein RmuC [Patescibacteria group bacterium]|nr:DNA recombination protein RmuC [Patescibacteria group bacterium]